VGDGRLCGSSPHTRGARPGRSSRHRHGGIIPAYAGSTTSPCRARTCRGDHPRIRGEHKPRCSSSKPWKGSSPHTRGAPDAERGEGLLERIIPAYAGSTSRESRASTTPMDHPRIRGEHSCIAERQLARPGSSPHTRGAPPPNSRGPRPERIIPAYAGSTISPVLLRWIWPDHPRIRGEHGQSERRPPGR